MTFPLYALIPDRHSDTVLVYSRVTIANYTPVFIMPILDYPVDPTFLLSFANFMLGIISLVFDFIRLIGPFGQIALFVIVVAIFARNIYSGPQAFQNLKS